MGKIIVVDLDGHTVEEQTKETVFKIFRAILVPGVKDGGKIAEMFNDIKNYERLTDKYTEPLSFQKTVEPSDMRSFVIGFNYKPKEKDFAKCYIFTSTTYSVDLVFCGIFTAADPTTTEFKLATLVRPITLWLPELLKQ